MIIRGRKRQGLSIKEGGITEGKVSKKVADHKGGKFGEGICQAIILLGIFWPRLHDTHLSGCQN